MSLGPFLSNITLNNDSSFDNPQVSFNTGSWSPSNAPIPLTLSTQTDLGSNQGTISVVSSVQALSLLLPSSSSLQYIERSLASSLTLETDGCLDAYSHVQCYVNHSVLWNITEPQPALSFSTLSNQPDVTDYITDAEHDILLKNIITSKGSYSDLFFVDLPFLNATGVVWAQSALFVYAYGGPLPNPYDLLLTPCTLELGWQPSTLRYDGQGVTSHGSRGLDDSKVRHAHANKDWLAATNPFLPDINMTAVNYLSQFINNINPSSGLQIISTLAAVTLSATSSAWVTGTTPPEFSYVFSGGFSILWDFALSPDLNVQRSLPIHFSQTMYRSGYGYGPNAFAVKVSLGILIVYCIVAVAHIVYSIITGTSSAAWDSISEIVALALNSRHAPELQNTCAGIQSAHVFAHRVRIASTNGTISRETDNGQSSVEGAASEAGGRHLELLFPSQSIHVVSGVRPNVKYGALKDKLN